MQSGDAETQARRSRNDGRRSNGRRYEACRKALCGKCERGRFGPGRDRYHGRRIDGGGLDTSRAQSQYQPPHERMQCGTTSFVAFRKFERDARRGCQRRWYRGVEYKRPCGVDEQLDERGGTGDEAAERSEGLAQRSEHDDALVAQTGGESRSPRAGDAERMRLVDEQNVVVVQVRQKVGDVRDVAIHAENRFGDDVRSRRALGL